MGQSNGEFSSSSGTAAVVRLLLLRARRSWGFRIAAILGALAVFLGLVLLTIVRGAHVSASSALGALPALPHLFAHAICWGVAPLGLFGTEQRAFVRDHEDGIRGLLGGRGKDALYGRARLVSSITTAATISVSFTALLAVATALAATGTGEAWRTWKSAGGGVLYSAVFAIVMGTLALAVLGGRGRGGGYLGLMTVLVLPELLEPLTTRALPAHLGQAIPVSIPSILSAISKPTSGTNFIAGLCAATIIVGLGYAYGKRERLRVDDEIAREARS